MWRAQDRRRGRTRIEVYNNDSQRPYFLLLVDGIIIGIVTIVVATAEDWGNQMPVTMAMDQHFG